MDTAKCLMEIATLYDPMGIHECKKCKNPVKKIYTLRKTS